MDESQTLYNNYLEFKRHLADHSYSVYSETELLEIYDVAGDNLDYYVQTEVLIMAARLFPDSEEFIQRKGFLYNRMFPSALHDFLLDNKDAEGLCWDILKMRDSAINEADVEQSLDAIIDNYDELSDEEIIRIAEFVRENHCEKWMIANCKKLQDKASYADTVLYETASLAHDYGDDNTAITLLDELTSIDAFRAENWMLMAECYQSLENPKEGLKALEYARAITPENSEIDFLESVLLLDSQTDLERALNMQLKYLEMNPGSSAAVHNISLAYQLLGRRDDAVSFLKSQFELKPFDSLIVQDLMIVDTENAREYLDYHRKNSEDTSDLDHFIKETIESLYLSGRYENVVELTEELSGALPDVFISSYYIWSLTLLNEYGKMCDLYDLIEKNHISYLKEDAETMLLFCYAMLKCGKFENVIKSANRTIRHLRYDTQYNIHTRINLFGCENALNDIIKLAELQDPDLIESFDPLKFKCKD